jgi:hypothetical protein
VKILYGSQRRGPVAGNLHFVPGEPQQRRAAFCRVDVIVNDETAMSSDFASSPPAEAPIPTMGKAGDTDTSPDAAVLTTGYVLSGASADFDMPPDFKLRPRVYVYRRSARWVVPEARYFTFLSSRFASAMASGSNSSADRFRWTNSPQAVRSKAAEASSPAA